MKLMCTAILIFLSSSLLGMQECIAEFKPINNDKAMLFHLTCGEIKNVHENLLAHLGTLKLSDPIEIVAIVVAHLVGEQGIYLEDIAYKVDKKWPNAFNKASVLFEKYNDFPEEELQKCQQRAAELVAGLDDDSSPIQESREMVLAFQCVRSSKYFLSHHFEAMYNAAKKSLRETNFIDTIDDVFGALYKIFEDQRQDNVHEVTQYSLNLLGELIVNIMYDYFGVTEKKLEELMEFPDQPADAKLEYWAKTSIDIMMKNIFMRSSHMNKFSAEDFLASILAIIAVDGDVLLEGFGYQAQKQWQMIYKSIGSSLAASKNVPHNIWRVCLKNSKTRLKPINKNYFNSLHKEEYLARVSYMSTEDFLSKRYDVAFATAQSCLVNQKSIITKENIFIYWSKAADYYLDKYEDVRDVFTMYYIAAFKIYLQKIMAERFNVNNEQQLKILEK